MTEPEYHMQFTTTVQIKPTSEATATGISYALVLEAPVPEDGGRATTVAGFQVASESRSTYEGAKLLPGNTQHSLLTLNRLEP